MTGKIIDLKFLIEKEILDPKFLTKKRCYLKKKKIGKKR